MKCICGFAAALLPLALASAAIAQNRPSTPRPALNLTTSKFAPPAQGTNRPAWPAGGRLAISSFPLQQQARTMIVGGWAPTRGVTVGVGLFSIPKSATANAQESRVNPMKDPTGKTSRIAAVGLNLAF